MAQAAAASPTPSALLTVHDVAAILRVSAGTVREWARTGYLPSLKIGEGPKAIRRFDARAVDRWIASHAEGIAGK